MRTNKITEKLIIFFITFAFSTAAFTRENISELSERIGQIQQEMDLIKKDLANTAKEPHTDTLVHLAGYADVGYIDIESDTGSFNAGTFSPILHFQYRDLVLLESELEFEVEENGETETNLEYLTIDWFINDYLILVSGKFLSPIGQFRQNLHPSWINKLSSSPPGFGHDGAAPISDVGFQLRGGFPIGEVRTHYAIFVSNGPELITELEDGEYELDGVEAEGFGSDSDGKKVFGGRLAVISFTGLELGVSAATGKATVTSIEDGDSSLLSNEGARDYDVIGADFSWQFKTFNFRGEYVKTEVSADTGNGTAASEGATWETWYTQGTFRLAQSRWELVARYTDFDSPHSSQSQQQWAAGVNYLFTNNFISKLNYELNNGEEDKETDNDRILLQLAYGF